MQKKIKLLSFLGATVALSCAFPTQQASAQYSAIATDPHTGAWGAAWDYGDPDEAAEEALAQCSTDDCAIDVTVYNGCGAVAHGSDGEFSWVGAAYDADRDQAEVLADEACDEASDGMCEVVVSNCSWAQ